MSEPGSRAKPCSQCGEVKPLTAYYKTTGRSADGRRAQCKDCYNETRKRHYARVGPRIRDYNRAKWREHRDRRLAYERQRYPARRPARLERARADWAALTPGQRKARIAAVKQWLRENPDRAQAINRRKYLKHRPRELARTRDWARNNPDAVRAIRDRRRAAKVRAGGSYDKADIAAIFKRYGASCFYCGVAVRRPDLDHFIPLSKGGSNGPENLLPACRSCNCSKGAKWPWEWWPIRQRQLSAGL